MTKTTKIILSLLATLVLAWIFVQAVVPIFLIYVYPSVSGGTFDKCYNIVNGHNLECSVGVATKKNLDINFCSKYEGQSDRANCVGAVAIAKKEVSYCKDMRTTAMTDTTIYPEKREEHAEFLIDFCTKSYALYLKDQGACTQIANEFQRLDCGREIAKRENDEQRCGHLSGDERIRCLTGGSTIGMLVLHQGAGDTMDTKIRLSKECESKNEGADRIGCYSYAYTFPGDKFAQWMKYRGIFDVRDLEEESTTISSAQWRDGKEKLGTDLTASQNVEVEIGGVKKNGFLLVAKTDTASAIFAPASIPQEAYFLSFKMLPVEIDQEAWITVHFDDTLIYTNYLKDIYIEASTYPEHPYADANVRVGSLKGKSGTIYIMLNMLQGKSKVPASMKVVDFKFSGVTPITQ